MEFPEQTMAPTMDEKINVVTTHVDVSTSDCYVPSTVPRKNRSKLLTLNKEWLLTGRTEESMPELTYVYNVNGLDECWNESSMRENEEMNDVQQTAVNVVESMKLDVGESFGEDFSKECRRLIENDYINAVRPSVFPETPEMRIRLTSEIPIAMAPRRLSYHDKEKVKAIIADYLEQGIIRQSSSEYASPIVLVAKKSGETRLCVDYRALNTITAKQNWPLPLIDDCVEFLGGKNCFTLMDLKNGFHQMKVETSSIKYTSFVTPNGQYEWVRVPFGLKNGPSAFQFFVNHIFRDMIEAGEIMIFIDDMLIATKGVQNNLRILKKVLSRLVEYGLEIKVQKCHFIQSTIDYLGYEVDKHGIRPNGAHVKAILNFPPPTDVKKVQSCLGLFSYFRRFVAGFARIAHPLTELTKKNQKFVFNEACVNAFEKLKGELVKAPILAIYDSKRETEVHTDASSHGYGAVLMQKQNDEKWHPVSYYSKKTSEAESKYHSFELETLAVMNAVRRWETFLKGIRFRIVTDCIAFRMTLSKKNINPRIARWALELENFDYEVEHRSGIRMGHVDALSRNVNQVVAVVTAEEVDFNLQVTQARDPALKTLKERLTEEVVNHFSLHNGLVYRQQGDGRLLLYVPVEMERNVIQLMHEKFGHMGVNKCAEAIKEHYWFPNLKEKIQAYIESCLRCIMHSEPHRVARTIHMIPKKPVPWDTLHLDHYGPLPNIVSKKKYILGIVDAFTKFVKLFPVNVTSTKEVCACLDKYFAYFGRPRRIIADRATCFTSKEFAEYLANNNIELVKNATASPQANGQIERVNRVLTPMLGKLAEAKKQSDWSRVLGQVEYALNNSVSATTKCTPSMLLFGVNQRGPNVDWLSEYLNESGVNVERDLNEIRKIADEAIQVAQKKSEEYHAGKNLPAKEFKVGEYVVIRNVDTTIGTNKKLNPKFRGPYVIGKVLPNDRYVVKDIENCQITQLPYNGILEAARIKHWVRSV